MWKDVKWIEYDDPINLHDFEKVHVNTSANQYTLRSIICPDTFMKMTRESFIAALLKQNSDELLVNARALVAKTEEELKSGTDLSHNPIKVNGLPNSIDSNNLLAIIGTLCLGKTGKSGQQRIWKSIKDSMSKKH